MALDLKTAPARYGELHTGPVRPLTSKQSVRMLMDAPVDWRLLPACRAWLARRRSANSASSSRQRALDASSTCPVTPWQIRPNSRRTPYPPEQIEALAVVGQVI
ncbi:MAG: hypothetical protein R2864_00405 [Syntrophotaleaceae bacterium]